MPEAGYAVFRSSWTSDALYLALIGKHGVARTHRSPIGSGHKQANEGAFIIHAGGTLLAMEPGYHSYDGRDSIVYSENHNVILVDGEGPDDVSFGTFLFGADAYMENALTSETLDRVTVRTHYRDADIERNAYFFDDRFIVMHDRLSSPESRTWTHQVHGNAAAGDGFTMNAAEHTASWTNSGMKLTAYVDATGASATQQAVNRKHSPGYHLYAQHAAMYTSVAGRDAAFHSVYIADRATVQPRFTPLDLHGNSSAVRLDMETSSVVSILQAGADGETVDAGPLGRISSDARLLVHAHYTGGSTQATFAEHVSEIIIDERGVFSADRPVTVSWHSSAGRMLCTVASDRAVEYYLRLPYEPKDVSGTGMLNWSMTGNMLRVQMSETQSDLTITLSSTPTESDSPATATQLRLSSVWPNPLDAARHDRLHASMTLNVPGGVELSIWNLIGRRVRTAQGTFLQGGKHMLSVPTTGLPAGMYLLRIKHMAGTIVRPFLIQ
jgi:hypothetical protein